MAYFREAHYPKKLWSDLRKISGRHSIKCLRETGDHSLALCGMLLTDTFGRSETESGKNGW